MSEFANPHFDLLNTKREYPVDPRVIYSIKITCLYCNRQIQSEDAGHNNGKCIMEAA